MCPFFILAERRQATESRSLDIFVPQVGDRLAEFIEMRRKEIGIIA